MSIVQNPSYPLGRLSSTGPIPLLEDDTTFIPAGVLEFGVGDRIVSPEESAALGGVAIHVREAATHREYLRFDCFDDGPHYHYIVEARRAQLVVAYDAVANGPLLDWTLQRLRRNLPGMLSFAGRPDLGPQLHQAAIDMAVDTVERRARAIVPRVYAGTRSSR